MSWFRLLEKNIFFIYLAPFSSLPLVCDIAYVRSYFSPVFELEKVYFFTLVVSL
jgi:hypothetical protein